MLEPPPIPEETIRACLRESFGLPEVDRLEFLPLGADVGTALYRVATPKNNFFLKLRASFRPILVVLPSLLWSKGMNAVIPPLRARDGQLWAALPADPPLAAILSPFVEGVDAYQRPLSERQWEDFGEALQFLHAAAPSPDLAAQLPREQFQPRHCGRLRALLDEARRGAWPDEAAAGMAALLIERQDELRALCGRVERLAASLRGYPPPFVLCHADLHAGNLHLAANDCLFLVDWDTLMLAPRERDLMYIGAGLLGKWLSPAEEWARFGPAYGPVQPDPAALAYYRYGRVIEDLVAFGDELLHGAAAGADRLRSLGFARSNFDPGGALSIARQVNGPVQDDRACGGF